MCAVILQFIFTHELKCVIEPSSGEKVSAPRFIEKLQPKHATDGSTIQFECQVVGNPRPLITWFRQTAVLLPSTDFKVSTTYST